MFEEFINAIRPSLPNWTYIEGCTEQDLEHLGQSQQVACLPEAYAAMMRLIGQCGVDWLFGYGKGEFNDCLTLKEMLIEDQGGPQRFTYPEDMFVFFHDPEGDSFFIFRTKDCIANPPVYEVGVDCYYLYANTFTELVLNYLVHDDNGLPMNIGAREKAAWEQEYIFDPQLDDFRPRISPYTQPLTIEQILSLIHERWTSLEGCTPEEIDELRGAQGAACLPETYRLLMASCGKAHHLRSVFSQWEFARTLKYRLRHYMPPDRLELPSDLFVFNYGSYDYYAFRTRDCLDDPEVIEIIVKLKIDGSDLVIRRHEPFSQFLRLEMDPNPLHRIQRSEQRRQLPLLTYDAALDDFVPLPANT